MAKAHVRFHFDVTNYILDISCLHTYTSSSMGLEKYRKEYMQWSCDRSLGGSTPHLSSMHSTDITSRMKWSALKSCKLLNRCDLNGNISNRRVLSTIIHFKTTGMTCITCKWVALHFNSNHSYFLPPFYNVIIRMG